MKELIHHLIDTIRDQNPDFDELHNVAFNQDYYVIGHYNAEQWLLQHKISPFEAMETIIEWESDNFGEVTMAPNAECVVNLFVYIKGAEIINGLNPDEPLLPQLEALL